MERSVLEQAMQALEASDQQIVQLLVLRSRLAAQLAQAVPAHKTHATVEERVSAVVGRLLRQHTGPLDQARLTSLFAWVVQLTEPFPTGISASNGAPKRG
jgi:chorismate mutase